MTIVDVHAHVLLPEVERAVAGRPGLAELRALEDRRNGPEAIKVNGPMIAERLAIARRTVDAHVRNILSKGGLTSRAQVATWLAAETPPPEGPGAIESSN